MRQRPTWPARPARCSSSSSPATSRARSSGAEGDRRSHDLLRALLAERFPDDRVRSEEDDQATELTDRPAGSGSSTPSTAPASTPSVGPTGPCTWQLAVDGAPAVGAVALPGLDLVLGTGHPPPLPTRPAVPRLVVSRTRPPEFVPFVAERLGAETVPMGSAGAKISAVVRGEAEVYVHAGGQYEWDSCAPVAVALAAGLHASRIDGSPLRYARPDPWLPDLVVCHPELADEVLAAVRDSGLVEGREPMSAPAGTPSPAPPVFGPARLGPLTLKNRIIKSATFEGASPRGAVTDDLIAFHERVARGGAAMTTVAYLAVSPEGRTDRHCVLLGPESVEGLSRLTAAVHAGGALASAQIGHAGPVANSRSNGAPALSPSRRFGASGALTRAATADDIARITEDYRQGAARAVEAGFDCIEIHLGHNYLLSSFLSPRLNRRTDGWGGSLEHRARFPRQVVAAVREGAGRAVAVTAKLNMADGVPGGFDVPESIDVRRDAPRGRPPRRPRADRRELAVQPDVPLPGGRPEGGVRRHPASADAARVQTGGHAVPEGVPVRGGLLPGPGPPVPGRGRPTADPARRRQPTRHGGGGTG